MSKPTQPVRSEDQARRELFNGVELRQSLRDQQSRAMTGYLYDELVNGSEQEMGLNPLEELELVDKSVNLIGHLFKYYIAKRERAVRLDELVNLGMDGGDHVVTWAGDGIAKLVAERIVELKSGDSE